MGYTAPMIRLLVALSLVACSRASESSEAKKLQSAAPPPEVTIPKTLAIAVEVDGRARQAIVAATLARTPPDFADDDRKAWLIATLVSEAATAGSVVEATAATGIGVKMVNPMPDGSAPALFLTRRGDIIASAIDRADPFPKFHGKGGRLHRAGDSQPRITAVAKLTITTPSQTR